MSRVRLLLTAAAAAGYATTVDAAPGSCFSQYQCMFQHNTANTAYTWDLSQACRPGGYTFTDVYNHTTSFNICGTTSQICAPNFPVYNSEGVAVQTWGNSPGGMCTNADTGLQVPCTPTCAVLALPFFSFQLQDESAPVDGGILLTYSGMPPDPADPNECPPGVNGLPIAPPDYPAGLRPRRRSQYSARTKVACGVIVPPCNSSYANSSCTNSSSPVDAVIPSSTDAGRSFGFVVLGASLALFAVGTYRVGQPRGWWKCGRKQYDEFSKPTAATAPISSSMY